MRVPVTERSELIPTGRTRVALRTRRVWWTHLAWIPAAGALTLGVSGILSGTLEISRSYFLLLYFAVAGPFLLAYASWNGWDVRGALRRHWQLGVLGGVVVGFFVVRNALGQEASPRPAGLELVGDVLWLGLVYGLLDALMLSVLPISAAMGAARALGWLGSWGGRFAAGVLALGSSLLVTGTYHFGFVEFRGEDLLDPLLGNGVMSLGQILAANPLASMIAHVAMHVASVMHGIDTTVQLPPHY